MVEAQAETMQTKELMVTVVQTLAVVEAETKALLPMPGDRQSDQLPQTQPTPAQMTTKSALSLLSRLVVFTLRCLRATLPGVTP